MRFFNAIGRFFRKNVFYITLALCIIAVGLGITFACVYGTDKKESIDKPIDGSDTTIEQPEEPVIKPVVFIAPVENGNIIKGYNAEKLVFSNTLSMYTVHLAVDYTGGENAPVLAVYGGPVESVETSLLEGTVVTIDHGNGLKSVYKSLLDDSFVNVGKVVEQGDKIGVISTSCRQEYKDGAHVHLEVFENDTQIDPMKYLITEEK